MGSGDRWLESTRHLSAPDSPTCVTEDAEEATEGNLPPMRGESMMSFLLFILKLVWTTLCAAAHIIRWLLVVLHGEALERRDDKDDARADIAAGAERDACIDDVAGAVNLAMEEDFAICAHPRIAKLLARTDYSVRAHRKS